jgi:cytochrome P450
MSDPTSWWHKLDWVRAAKVEPSKRRLRAIATDIIRRRKTEGTSAAVPRDLLGAMMQQGEEPEERMIDQVFTFMRAGHDTTSATIQWVLLELAQRPLDLFKCQAAVDAVMGPRKGARGEEETLTYEQVLELMSDSFLGSVLKETMRMRPALPIFGRTTADEPTQLGPYLLPPGTWVAVAAMALHFDPKWWDRPHEFLPERWSSDAPTPALKHPFQYVPFSAGSRSCIGQRFGQFESTNVLALLLRRFDFTIHQSDLNNVRAIEAILYTPRNVRLTVSIRKDSLKLVEEHPGNLLCTEAAL